MSEIKLSKEEIERLKKIQKQTKNRRVYNKTVVILGLNSGIDYKTLENILSLDEITIRRYEKEYLEEGIEKFLQDNYRPYWGKLDSFQLAELSNEIINKVYSNTKEIVEWLKIKFNISYNHQGLVHLLHKLGFVYKKTKLVPAKANSEKQKEFIEKFNEIKENLKDSEVIYFGDATHPQHNTQVANCWILKGNEKKIKSNTGRTRININGVLNPETKEVIVREEETINAQTTINLFKEVEEKNTDKTKIYIIVDNAKYYKNKQVTEYLETSKINLIFLPTYSPNLNLIERLWKFMKKEVINNKYYEKALEFKANIQGFFNNIHKYKKELNSLITYNFQILDSS